MQMVVVVVAAGDEDESESLCYSTSNNNTTTNKMNYNLGASLTRSVGNALRSSFSIRSISSQAQLGEQRGSSSRLSRPIVLQGFSGAFLLTFLFPTIYPNTTIAQGLLDSPRVL
ncbi:hypothetical protein ACA910_004431 [Epithemia clementina (nom. ined.)]